MASHKSELDDMALLLLFRVVLVLCLVSACTDDRPCEDSASEPERRACSRALSDC